VSNQLVILAAGKGKRIGHKILPKVLVKLGRKPIISYILEQVNGLDLPTPPVIVVGFKSEMVKKSLGERYVYAFQKSQLGTGHAVICAKGKLNADNVLVLYGDMPFIKETSLRSLMSLHGRSESIFSMFTVRIPSFKKYPSFAGFGRVLRNKAGELMAIKEARDCRTKELEIKELNPGIYMFDRKWLMQNLPKIKRNNEQKEYYLTSLIELAVKQKIKIATLPINFKEVFGINTKNELEMAKLLVR
jgi:bifunctional UDP-N-acetylglucosamine pyrophosphorylase/glucosamine-1-phosphate N-acetyltransferase